jgi:glutamate/tyrosine decarboxylase-like PLP-dependent enzyme
MHHLGDDGYLKLTRQARIATVALANHIDQHDDLVLRARPDATLLSFGALDPQSLNIFAVADQLRSRGWYVDRQQPPDSLHCTVNAIHHDKIESFVADLDEAVELTKTTQRQGSVGQYGNLE